jgi:predicted secreted hydrolase
LYYSQTRLETSGEISVAGTTFAVQGLSWLDREISTSALSAGQTGWDWFALQLDDGSELMAYVLRRADGTIDTFSSGTWIAPDGTTTPLGRDDFQVQVLDLWISPHTGGDYPARWRIDVPAIALSLEVQPLVADQELDVSFLYWEGAVRVTGSRGEQAVSGYGYVELTGYVESLEGEV